MSLSDSPLPRAGQRWWHPEIGEDFTPGTAVLEERVAPSGESGWASSGEPGWGFQGDDGNAGWIPEADLLARGKCLMSPSVRKMTRQEIALHALQAEFMREAPTDEWVELPGSECEGLRIPDYDDGGLRMMGCWYSRAKED